LYARSKKNCKFKLFLEKPTIDDAKNSTKLSFYESTIVLLFQEKSYTRKKYLNILIQK